MAVPITPISVGDVVRLKKAHPCGANEWEVTKLGMDIGLACHGCGRKVRLERYEFDRRFRGWIVRVSEAEAEERVAEKPDGQPDAAEKDAGTDGR